MEELKEGRDLKKEVEAILFAAGRKVDLEEIAALCRENDLKRIDGALQELKKDYNSSDSPMFLIQEGSGWKMTVKERYLGLVKDVAPHTELNKALLETLAIVAWKQPVMQADVIRVRGSSAYEHIRELVEMGFITKVKHGRSYVLKPSTRFFDYFDLPSKEAVKEVFKDVEIADADKRKGLDEKPREQQQRIGDESGKKVGQLEVYKSPKGKEQGIGKAEEEMETEKLGKLEVFEERAAKGEEEDGEEIEEEAAAEDLEEGKTKKIVEELMEEEKDEEGESRDESEDKEERRVSRELEEFAGIGEEEKEGKKTEDDGSEEPEEKEE
ncbi:MAG TPA: SMC-Scp complex subunit ScpB [Candidatus Nanoarchaeia archaeon]|nr:SMC-Scp complex subunit ScpB [Candidatus Nanoarchaeia archaeon]